MTLDPRAMTWVTGLRWGGVMAWAASFYPGYRGPAGFGSAVVVTLCGAEHDTMDPEQMRWMAGDIRGP